MTGKSTSDINIYISSAMTTEDIKLLEELKKRLTLLEREADIRLWDKQIIVPGTNRKQEITTYISRAHLILLLLSPDFIYECFDEMQVVTNRMMKIGEDVHVIPILMRTTPNLEHTPIGDLQPLPTDREPIHGRVDREKALGEIAEHIRTIIERKRLASSNAVRLPLFPTQSSPLPFAPLNRVHSSATLAQSGNFPSEPRLAHSPVRLWYKVGLVFFALLVIALLAIVLVSRTFRPPDFSPPGEINDPVASSIVTTIQIASAVDKTSGLPIKLATSFKTYTDIYTTFQLNLNGVDISQQHPGYVQAKYFKAQKRIFTSHVLTIDKNTITADSFPAFQYHDPTTAGIVELYWCRVKDCGDAKFAQKASFTVS